MRIPYFFTVYTFVSAFLCYLLFDPKLALMSWVACITIGAFINLLDYWYDDYLLMKAARRANKPPF